MATKDNPNKDLPWIANYPPLDEWLRNNNARCDWQLKLGKDRHASMIEQWRLPGSMPFVVLVMANQHGWEIFTPSQSTSIDETLLDVRRRIFAGRQPHARSRSTTQ